jgi:outer membrane protein assembly factor BamB/plastocyanin
VVFVQRAGVSSKAIPTEVKTYAKEWPLPNKDYNNSRATLDSTITAANVNTLGLAWSYDIVHGGPFGTASSTPLILNNTVLFQDLKGNVFALDFKTGALKWSKIYNSSNVAGPNGPAVGYGKVFVARNTSTIAALDLNTGKELWTNDKLSPVPSTGIDIQPQVYDNMVYVSTVPGTGDVFYKAGGIGVIYALDQATGKIKWNFSTVQGNLWGHPEVNSGGGCWYPPAIDTKTGTMYWAVANPAPFAGAPGWPSGSSFDTALYTDSIVALDHKTGKLLWYTQVLSHDIYDHDLQIAPIIARANISGVSQDIILASGKMGNVYALNKETGRLLWMLPVGIHENDMVDPILNETQVLPGILGGVETQMAYSRSILYVPVVDLPTNYTPTGINFASVNFFGGKGELVAINVDYGKILWTKMLPSANFGAATVVTDVVFTATFDGLIYAFHAKTGDLLATFKAPAGTNAWPAISGDTIIWPCGVGANPSLIALKLGAPPLGPTLSITSPTEGATNYGHNVTIKVAVGGFTIVNALGSANVPDEGHIHYFKDVLPPTTPGVPAFTAAGTWAPSINTSYRWTNVSAGTHMFSAELVNNDHTPLEPAVVAFVNVTVVNQTFVTRYISAQNVQYNESMITVPVGSNVTIVFDNLDSGVEHNFAVYTSSAATTPIFIGTIVTGPTIVTYKFDAPIVAGSYYFRCDVHPTIMQGVFMVV